MVWNFSVEGNGEKRMAKIEHPDWHPEAMPVLRLQRFDVLVQPGRSD
jgi:hypothetical protein